MQARVQKWGNSLAVRIPKSFAAQTQLKQDSVVEMTMEDGKIVLLPVAPVSLEELLDAVTPENLHHEVETGSPIGQEIW